MQKTTKIIVTHVIVGVILILTFIAVKMIGSSKKSASGMPGMMPPANSMAGGGGAGGSGAGNGDAVLTRIGQTYGNQGCLRAAETRGRNAEVVLRSCFDTEDTVSHLDAVEIHLHDTLLGPQMFNQDGKPCLAHLADIRAIGRGKDVLGCLLRNGSHSYVSR